jgi:predicted outer membrane repeat protein
VTTRSFKRAYIRRIARERRRASVLRRKGGQVAGLALTAGTLIVSNASAKTYTVTTSGDDASPVACAPLSGGYICGDLRDAVAAANADGGADTINFHNGLTGTITLTNGTLNVTDAGGLTIDGPGANALTISGDVNANNHADSGDTQLFTIANSSSASNVISNLTLTDGYSSGSNGAAIDVTANSPLTLTGDTISDSVSGETADGGGAIYTDGNLTISGSSLSGNQSANSGGAIYSEKSSSPGEKYHLTIINSTITGNTGAFDGGAIIGAKYTTITNSALSGNTVSSNPGPGAGYGGAIQMRGGTLVMSGSAVTNNSSPTGGGGIDSLSNYGVEIQNSTVSGNTSESGGGLEFGAFSHLQGETASSKYNPVDIENSTISGNHASHGAGIDFAGLPEGDPVQILRSTISGNIGTGTASYGGGVLVQAKYVSGPNSLYIVESPIDVIDSTIAGNTATFGAGVSVGDDDHTDPVFGTGQTKRGSLAFDNSTVAANHATGAGGGVFLSDYTGSSPNQSPTVTLNSTIVSGNQGGDLAKAAGSTSGGFNGAFSLIQAPASDVLLSQQSDILGKDPLLGPLQNNGGPTKTMLPAGTSPVIDQGHAPNSLKTDQRGDARTVEVAGIPDPPGGDGTDIGALELSANSVTVPPAGFSATVNKAAFGSGSPLLVGSSTPVSCAVRLGTLRSCALEVRSKKGTLLASGEATSTGAASVSMVVTPTPAGVAALKRSPLGLTEAAKFVGETSASGQQTLTGHVRLLAAPSITLKTKRSATLSKRVKGELKQAAKLLSGAKSIKVIAYASSGKHVGSLTKAEAKAAATALSKDGFKGKLKSAGTSKGSANQLVITFKL